MPSFLYKCLLALLLIADVSAGQIYRDTSNLNAPYEIIRMSSKTKKQVLEASLNISNGSSNFLIMAPDQIELGLKNNAKQTCLNCSIYVVPPGGDKDISCKFDVQNDSSLAIFSCRGLSRTGEKIKTFEPFNLQLDFGKGYVSEPLYLHIKNVSRTQRAIQVTLHLEYSGKNLLVIAFGNIGLNSEDGSVHYFVEKVPDQVYYQPDKKHEFFTIDFPVPEGVKPKTKMTLVFNNVFSELSVEKVPGFTIPLTREDLFGGERPNDIKSMD